MKSLFQPKRSIKVRIEREPNNIGFYQVVSATGGGVMQGGFYSEASAKEYANALGDTVEKVKPGKAKSAYDIARTKLTVKAGVPVKDYNSNNAWGFGGMTGKQYDFPNGYILRKGRAHFRHADAQPAQYALDPEGKRIGIDELQENVKEWLE